MDFQDLIRVHFSVSTCLCRLLIHGVMIVNTCLCRLLMQGMIIVDTCLCRLLMQGIIIVNTSSLYNVNTKGDHCQYLSL